MVLCVEMRTVLRATADTERYLCLLANVGFAILRILETILIRE